MSRGHAAFQIPVTLDAANRRKDRSVSIRFSSTLELGTVEFAELDRLTPSTGWLLFSANEFDDTDVPTEDAPGDDKSPSQRLRSVLFIDWQQNTDRSEDFKAYYRRKIESLITKVKERLT
jgi:hypothetical protein